MKKLILFSTLFMLSGSIQAQVCTVIITHIINGNQVQYFGTSPDNPASWSWFFNGGTPMTSSSQNQTVTYSSPGQYICALSVSGGVNGCSPSLSNENDTVNITTTGITDVSNENLQIHLKSQNPPVFEITNEKSREVRIVLEDINGRLTETIFEGTLSKGINTLGMKTINVASGIYLLVLHKEDGIVTKKFFLQ